MLKSSIYEHFESICYLEHVSIRTFTNVKKISVIDEFSSIELILIAENF